MRTHNPKVDARWPARTVLSTALGRLARVDQQHSSEVTHSETGSGTGARSEAIIHAEGVFLWE
jgi:hypothetical protein